FRNTDGTLIHGSNAQEARLDPNTLRGMQYKKQTVIPHSIARAINNHMLRLHHPEMLRIQAARNFVNLHDDVHQPAATRLEVDAHIAALFPQNYTSIYLALHELKNHKTNDATGEVFMPRKILDIGFGPATGMVALNELMGEDFRPEVKDAVIMGDPEMIKRAKIILSRQICESPVVNDESVSRAELKYSVEDELPELYDETPDNPSWGPVDTNKIKVKTKLRSDMPSNKKYDLIIMTHQLLKDTEKFPRQIDRSVEQALDLLEPQGHLVIVERGNPLGFETIARARQVMIRPEKHPLSNVKIPQPWIRGSTVKPKNQRRLYRDQIESELVEMDAEAERLNQELNAKFGEVTDDDLKFEFEKEAIEAKPTTADYHLSILGPCSHHGKCPLQTGKPGYYNFPAGKKLPWCHFSKSFTRPKFSMELKKGLRLATPWASPTDGIGMKGSAPIGKGRAGGNNYEVANYSYLLVERAANSGKMLQHGIDPTDPNKNLRGTGYLDPEDMKTWPRIVNQPKKAAKHVTFTACGASGQMESWVVAKSKDKQAYHDSRKVRLGDLWAFASPTVHP
ncbi:hypothetical protein BABINDRAFT_18897, partial [Babjeviella inositovora NRRL Y-12698]